MPSRIPPIENQREIVDYKVLHCSYQNVVGLVWFPSFDEGL